MNTTTLRKMLSMIFLANLIVFPLLADEQIHTAKGWTGKIIARGAQVHSANGIEFDSADRLCIASLFGNNITVMDPDSGKILQRLGPAVGVDAPDDVAIGPDGSLYWTSLFTGEVGRITPDGIKSTAALLPEPVNPIAFSSSGRLFVGASFGDRLYEVDPQGIKRPRLIAKNLGGINGMDFGPDGFLYAPLVDQGKVIRITVNSGAFKRVADGLTSPAAVNFDSHGRLYVTEYLTGQVLRIDTQTGSKEVCYASTRFGQLSFGLPRPALRLRRVRWWLYHRGSVGWLQSQSESRRNDRSQWCRSAKSRRS